MTCRQIFYRLVSQGLIAKTEAEYQRTVVRLLGRMRLDGTVPFDLISDNTRWVRRARSFHSLEAMLDDCQKYYRRAIWRDQPAYVEIWLEKDALAGVVYEETGPWDVPLYVSRGYASLSFLHSAAATLKTQGKPCYLYHFGDHDPSGKDIGANIERRLREFAPDVEIHFQKVAVTPPQIRKWKLQTRPTKKTDSRAKRFKGDSVDVDAIEPRGLRKLVRDCIEQHIDADLLDRTRCVEKAERRTIQHLIAQFQEGSQ